MAEFKIVTQYLDVVDPTHGPVTEELRTLQVKRSADAVAKVHERAKWEKFGKAKANKADGVTNVVKDEVLIEPPSGLWKKENDDAVAHRLVSSMGKVNIKVRESSNNTPTPGHSRRNSGSSQPGVTAEDDSKEGGPMVPSASTGSTGTMEDSLPSAPTVKS